MSDKLDWRLTNQIDYLKDKLLKHVNFKRYSDSWDHEHCEFCFEKFNDETKKGYCTLDNYHWICEKCFDDFKDMFNWKMV